MKSPYIFLVASAILFGAVIGLSKFFADLGFSNFEIGFYSLVFSVLFLLPIILFKRELMIKKDMIKFFAVYGLILAFLHLTQFLGVVLGVPVAIVALLLYSQPIWTTIFGKFFLKEEITKRKIQAVAIALIGVILVVKPWDIQSAGPILGIASSLLAGIALSLWVIFGRMAAIRKQHFVTMLFGRQIFAVLWLLLFWIISYPFVKDISLFRLSANFPADQWIYFALYTLFAFTISNLMFNIGIQKIQSSTAGIVLLIEPVSAAILAALLFAEPITSNVILGGALILFSNYFIMKEK